MVRKHRNWQSYEKNRKKIIIIIIIIRIINNTFEHVLNYESNIISDKYRDINM